MELVVVQWEGAGTIGVRVDGAPAACFERWAGRLDCVVPDAASTLTVDVLVAPFAKSVDVSVDFMEHDASAGPYSGRPCTAAHIPGPE